MINPSSKKFQNIKFLFTKMTIDYACGTVLPILANKNITLRDILSVGTTKHTLILSAMLVDWDWLFESVGSIPMTVFVDGACGLPISLPKNKWLMGLRHPKNPECRIFAPPGAPYSKMHAKLAIVLMESFIRIMITSANLVQGDWEERSNIAYIQDFPASDSPCGGDFGISLCQILKSMGLSAELLDRIQNNYNYGKALVIFELTKLLMIGPPYCFYSRIIFGKLGGRVHSWLGTTLVFEFKFTFSLGKVEFDDFS